MWVARNNILNKDLKIFTFRPTRNPDGYWEDLRVNEYDENRRYGFIVSVSDIIGDRTIGWDDEPIEVTIHIPIKEKYNKMSQEQSDRYWGRDGGYPGRYMRDSWYGD